VTKKIYILIVFTLSLFSNTSWADHGIDFLLSQTARIGEAGSIYGILRQDYIQHKNEKAFVFEPLLSWNAYNWLSLEINSDAEKTQGESFNYEATLIGLRIRLTPKGQALVLGVTTRYTFSANSESEDAFKFSSLGTYQINTWLFGMNINYKKHGNSRRELSYSASIKREIRHHLGLGVEIAGELEGKKNGEVVIGIFNELTHHFQINVGIGTGFNDDVELTAKTAIIWRFK